MEQKHFLLSAALFLGLGVGIGIWVDQIGFLLAALGVEIGLLCLGLAIWVFVGDHVSNRISSKDQIVMEELMKLVIDGKDSEVTFDKFPYYLSERIKILLTSAGYFHLKHDSSKHTRNLSPVTRAILLSGPAEFYHEELAKALAHYFESKLLVLDVNYFSSKMQAKYGCPAKEPYFKRSISEATLECVSGLFSSLSILAATGAIRAPSKSTSRYFLDEKICLNSLYKVLVSISETGSVILYIKDVEKVFLRSPRMYSLFQQLLNKLSGSVLVLGSRNYALTDRYIKVDEKLTMVFPYNIDIKPPQDEAHMKVWKSQIKEATKKTQLKDYTIRVAEVLAANDLDCDDLDTISHTDMMLLSKHAEEIVASAIFNHLKDNKNPEYRNGILILSAKSLCYVLSLFQEGESGEKDNKKTKKESEKDDARKDKPKGSKKDSDIKASAEADDGAGKDKPKVSKKDSDVKASTKAHDGAGKDKPERSKKDSDIKASTKADGGAGKDKSKESKKDKASSKVDRFCSDALEEQIRQELVPANEIKVTFSDIGALDDVKESLQEAVMLPLRRPDLFKGNGILKPCKGVLLFGPPGTGKTMLAKAIAKEAGASFINVSSSTIHSMWHGQSEKNVRALFSAAAKVAPTIIFIDEVDSMLGQRSTGEHSAMRRVKNEFMSRWDGLLSKPDDRIIVLAATNMPFDLDEAIIRRFQRRIMVGLPSAENRETILKTLLANEKHDDIDFKELSTMTEGYSGSDLKNLCMTAAYRPLKELIQQEKEKEMKNKKKVAEAEISKDASNDTEEDKEDQAIALRPLNMEDQAEISKHTSNDTEEDKEDEVIALGPLNMEDQAEISKDDSNATEEDKEDQVIAFRALNMEDMRQAKNKVAASFASEGSIMNKLKEWNNLYGEEGSRKKEEQLSYFL
ncbi:unnamed protein product [Trifolium pratense]|uniref:Uncharacterized protein n=1 Tax=Trifolium pratense TaxID=57577 RepID=A0ACB0ID72_TRIPR|nr:unnamed protein product [Trifolium pratense]